jgi:DNA-binding NarL/FixJ family response regulator
MSSQPISILLADDQDLIREALQALLATEPGIAVVGQARNGFEAVEQARRLKPDVVLMDVRMPGLAGPEATTRIKGDRALSRTRVLILTTFEDRDALRACLRSGADGFIGKGTSTSALIEAIRAVRRGESPLSPRVARFVLNGLDEPSRDRTDASGRPPGGLTLRELDIVRLVGLGLTNEDIGRRLSISPATAKTHVRNAMRKLRVHDRAQLVALIHRGGLDPGQA